MQALYQSIFYKKGCDLKKHLNEKKNVLIFNSYDDNSLIYGPSYKQFS